MRFLFAILFPVFFSECAPSKSIYRYQAFFKVTASGVNDHTKEILVSDSTKAQIIFEKVNNQIDTVYRVFVETLKHTLPSIDTVIIHQNLFSASVTPLPERVEIGKTKNEHKPILLIPQQGKIWCEVHLTFLGKNARNKYTDSGDVYLAGKITNKIFKLTLALQELAPEFRM